MLATNIRMHLFYLLSMQFNMEASVNQPKIACDTRAVHVT